ncbi:MAG: PA2779 family protein [Massilia sp.]
MIHPLKKIFVHTLITAFMFTGLAQTAQAAMISTEQVVNADAAQLNRAKVAAAFSRADVRAELQKMGVNTEEAAARVASLTDAETASIANQVDSLPAGGDGIVGAIVFIFVLLLVTDILGLTKVFPFTKSMRR